MKRYCTFLAVTASLLIVLPILFAQVDKGPTKKEFMREKLERAQSVLKGLALGDFELIEKEAKRLTAMSQEATWEVFENPEYANQSAIFRRSAQDLIKAAQAKNLDGSTLAYVRVTMHCVECHKLVRGKLVASVERPAADYLLSSSRIENRRK